MIRSLTQKILKSVSGSGISKQQPLTPQTTNPGGLTRQAKNFDLDQEEKLKLFKELIEHDSTLEGLPPNVMRAVKSINYNTSVRNFSSVTFHNGREVKHGPNHEEFITHCILVHDLET